VRRALGIMEPLAVGLTACPCCGTGMDESHIAQHVTQCGVSVVGPMLHVHTALASVVQSICREAGGAVGMELPGLLDGQRRPGDVTVIGYAGVSRHLVIDVSVAHVCTTSNQRSAWSTPGASARLVEDSKVRSYRGDCEARGHRFVPFVVEDGGRVGGQATALLDELAVRAAMIPRAGSWTEVRREESRGTLLARWLQMISIAIHGSGAELIRCSLIRARQDSLDIF